MSSGPPRFDVGVVGVGRAGGVLAAALDRAGHRVVAAHAVSELSRLRVESMLPQATVMDVVAVVDRVDLVLLTVPDDVLPGLIASLAAGGHLRPGQILVHASGRYGVAVCEPATRCGAIPLALHPVMTLTGTSLDLDRLAGCPFGVTSDPAVRPMAEALVVEMGGEPVWVDETNRGLYHAALANASNHLVALTVQSMDLLSAAGVADPGTLLRPLMTASLDNALQRGDEALTGPVMRGDARTVAEHLRVLNELSAHTRDSYQVLARLTADRAIAAGLLTAQRAEALLDVLTAREERQ